MKKIKIPKYRIIKIYHISTLLYFFLVLPFVGFFVFQNLPEMQKNSGISEYTSNNQTGEVSDEVELPSGSDSVRVGIDSSISTVESESIRYVHEDEHKGRNKRIFRFFNLYLNFFLLSLVLGILFNVPFKIYLRRKRKHKPIGMRLGTYCKKFILLTPVINCFILFIPHAVSHIFGLSELMSPEAIHREAEYNLFRNFFYVSIVSAFLTLLFVYFWQKNRVHLRYIEFFYTEEELRQRIFRFRSGRIGRQLGLASVITTCLPLAIVMLYIVLSLTSITDLQMEEFSECERIVLFGDWGISIDMVTEHVDIGDYEDLYYVSAVDSIVMFMGIGTGILVSLIYIFLIVKWTTRSIVYPVKELLGNMKKIRTDGVIDFTIVRTNDEVGELAEVFNIMIQRIKNYISSISQINEELEERVAERTKEIADQKEEIEAQKEEIEVQLEMVIDQKNTIEGQKHQILDSIHYAKRIQTAILPPEEMLRKTLKDYFVLNNPRDIVSGDFYWSVVKDNKVYIAVADCTGHGVPGAFLSILGISFLNEIISTIDSHSSGEILGRLRESLIFSLHQRGEEGEAQDGMEVALCILDLEHKTLQFSGANRPLYLVRKVNKNDYMAEKSEQMLQFETRGNYHLLKYQTDHKPIGIYNETFEEFSNNDISLLPGDSIYLFTDGYVDQIGGPNRKTYRVKYFRELLLSIQDKDMSEQKIILEKNIRGWRGNLEQTDDILVFGMKF